VGKPSVVATLGGVVTFVAGFGVLSVWSVCTTTPAGLLRLGDFYSATWGDGLFLPLAVGSLLYLVAGLGSIGRRSLAGLAAVGLVAGVVSQVAWLVDPAPRLNWTLPEPHHFAAAGWYHAVFLAVLSAVFVALLGAVVIGLRKAPAKDVMRSAAFTVFLLSMGGFAALVVRDGEAEPFSLAQLATWALVLGGLLGLLLGVFALARASWRLVASRLAAVAIWSATVIAASYLAPHPRIALFAAVAMGVAVATVMAAPGRRITSTTVTAAVYTAAVMTIAMAITVQQQPGGLLFAVLAAVLGAILGPLFVCAAFGLGVQWAGGVWVGLLFPLITSVGLVLSQPDVVTNATVLNTALTVCTFLPGVVIRQVTARRFQQLVEAENGGDAANRNAVAVQVWTWLLGAYSAVVVAVVTLTVGAVTSKGFQVGAANDRLDLVQLSLGASGVVLAMLFSAWLAKRTPVLQLVALAPAMVGVVAWVALLLATHPIPYQPYYVGWVGVTSLLLGAVVWESVISNIARLNRQPATPATWSVAACLAILSVVNAYWLLGGVASGFDKPEPLAAALACAGLVVAVQMSAVVCLGIAAQPEQLKTPYATWFNLFQDNLLFLGLVLVFSFIPLFVYRHTEPLSWTKFLDTAVALGPVLGFTGAVLMLTLHNNREHLDRKISEFEATPPECRDDLMPVDSLRKHIQFQNRSAIALAATTVIGMANGLQDVRDLGGTIFWLKQ